MLPVKSKHLFTQCLQPKEQTESAAEQGPLWSRVAHLWRIRWLLAVLPCLLMLFRLSSSLHSIAPSQPSSALSIGPLCKAPA